MDEDINKESINQFLKENKHEEIAILLDISKKKKHFSWNDLDDNVSPKTWGNAIQKFILEPVNKRQFELQNYAYINKQLDTDKNVSESINTEKNNDDYETDNLTDKETQSDNVTDESETELPEENETELPEIDISSAKWTWVDKGLATITMLSITGFTYEPIRNIIYSILNPVFGILVDLMPFYLVILILATVTSMWSTYVREYYFDSSEPNNFKKHILDMRGDSLLSLPDDATSQDEDRLVQLQSALMKSKLKPFVWILSITIPTIVWIFTMSSIVGVGETITFPIFGVHTWSSNVFLLFQAYIFWYIICSIAANQIIKRSFNLINIHLSK